MGGFDIFILCVAVVLSFNAWLIFFFSWATRNLLKVVPFGRIVAMCFYKSNTIKNFLNNFFRLTLICFSLYVLNEFSKGRQMRMTKKN